MVRDRELQNLVDRADAQRRDDADRAARKQGIAVRGAAARAGGLWIGPRIGGIKAVALTAEGSIVGCSRPSVD